MVAFWITFTVVAVLSVPFTLAWWHLGDRWADSEHQRFTPKQDHNTQPDNAIILGDPESPDFIKDNRSDS